MGKPGARPFGVKFGLRPVPSDELLPIDKPLPIDKLVPAPTPRPDVPGKLGLEDEKPGVVSGLRPPVPRPEAPIGILVPPTGGNDGDMLGMPRFGDIVPPFIVPTWANAAPLARRTAAAVSGATFLSTRAIAVCLVIWSFSIVIGMAARRDSLTAKDESSLACAKCTPVTSTCPR